MRVRMATLVGTLLVLAAFGVPEAAAKTGDTTCAASEIWVDDPDDDGGQFFSNELDPSGLMEIKDLAVEETGTSCENITWTFTVGDEGPNEPDSVTYTADLLEPSGATDDWTITFTFGSGEGATLYKGDEAITTGASSGGTGSAISLTADKALFVGLTLWEGADIPEPTVTGQPASLTFTKDSASSDVDLLVNFGLDADSDGLPDQWEKDTFGDTTTSDGNSTTDTDGDGISDADEFANGTDPNDADDPPAETDETDENETEEETIEDEDGVPGLGENETIPAGGTYCTVFHEAGEFEFHDANGNKLTVEVEAPHDDGNGTGDEETHEATITSDGFDPDTLHIHTGDEVCFTNDDTEDQTVQSADDDNGIDFSKLSDNGGYTLIALGGAAAVTILSIIALAARWKL